MARRKKSDEAESLEGTVEGLAHDHFEKEKEAYEKATGEKVTFVPPVPTTRTPLAKTRRWGKPEEKPDTQTEADTQTENETEGETSAE